jgi:hypothetical protein
MKLEQLIRRDSDLWAYIIVGVFEEFQSNITTNDWSEHIIPEVSSEVNHLTIESNMETISFEFYKKSGYIALPIEGFSHHYISNYTKILPSR